MLDPNVYHIDCAAENYTIELNMRYSDVFENIIKGSISIIKHTDDGSTQIETPEEGAKFEVFLKASGSYAEAKETERDILTCDENGFAQTKDLPYGVYIVHQVSGWDGRELMDDFEVYISQNGATHVYLGARFGLTEESIVMLEQIVTIDRKRLKGYVGTLDAASVNKVEDAMRISLGLASGRGCGK